MGWLAILLLAADILLVGLVATQSIAWPPVASIALHAGLLLAAVWSSRRRAATAPPAATPTAEPAAPPVAEASAIRATPAPASTGHHHVMLVEDEADLRALVQRILQEEGYRVSCASHAADARELLEQGKLPDALITDLSLPGDDGVLLAGEFRRRWPDLPVLFTSGYPDRLERIDQQRMAGVSTLPKPFPPDQLVSKLESLIALGSRGQGKASG